MSLRSTNRIRPALDALEGRDVCFAGVALGIPLPHPLPPVGQVGLPPGPRLHAVDSVVTLRNDTAGAVRFTLRWVGSDAVTSYSLLPGESIRVAHRQMERIALHPTAVVQVESGPGVRTYRVAAGLTPVGPDGTSTGGGRSYAFRTTPIGVGLFAHPKVMPTR